MGRNEICRLCLKLCKANLQLVLKTTKELLELLLVEMDLDISVNPVTCKECIENLQECFEFKSVCILNEKYVIDVLESRHVCKINMTQVYLKNEKSNSTLSKMEEVCRFCTKPVMKFFSIDKLNEGINFSDMVQKFLPEVTLCVTSNPVCCSNCLNSLKSYFTFLKNCQDVEEHIKNYCKVEKIKEKVSLNNVVQSMLKHVVCESYAEKSISRLKKEIIDEVVATEDQTVETYSLYPAKTEIIIKEEQIIEINSADFIYMDTITTEKQLKEIVPSDADTKSDTKICNMVKSNMKLLFEEKMSENCDDKFSEGCIDENNTVDIDMEEIKIEDVDIKHNTINMDRSLLTKTTETNENGSDMDSCREDIVEENNSKTDTSNFDQGDHERYEKKPDKLQCPYFNYKSSCRSSLTHDLKTVHGEHLLYCHHCSYRTYSEDSLKKHQVMHGDKAKFQCPQCQKVFSSKMSIDNHFLIKHENLRDIVTSKIHSCNICSFKTTIKSSLLLHIHWKHSNLRSYICKGCKKTFKQKGGLDSHIVSHHQQNFELMNMVTNKIYNCDHCTYRCTLKSKMKIHIKTHGIRLLSRQHNKTHSEDCLKKHQVVHGDIVKFKCPQCPKVFTSKSNMENHFLKNHDNLCDTVTSKVHSCNICSYKTTMKAHLFDHINRKHSRLKKYQCSYCLHTFVQKGELKQHISLVHLNLRKYDCKGCKKTFNRKVGLDYHIVARHQTNFDLMKTVTTKIKNCNHCTFKCIQNFVMKRHVKTHGKLV